MVTSANAIRDQFLNFFAAEGHELVPSASLVPRDDPTLMFTNAGMVPFKNVFTGQEKRSYVTATSSQKCVRAGGKHNDLDNVGYTARHHTFFEMLGNFSFGDYFKERAIELAWRLLRQEWGLPADRLLVTVYHDDEEAASLWRRIAGLGEDRIIRIASSDNFWSMGDTGPCGPCSEIFYDHGPDVAGGPPGSADADGDRFVEIWNLVFMQFDQASDGTRSALPKPSIDTGMGLERIAAVLQGTHDNYAIDLMRGLIEASAAASHTEPDGPHRVSHRVIADHLRASGFLLADGVSPSNEGRGYVLRRIMRRAMRHAHLLGMEQPLLYRLVPNLVSAMGAAYPELGRAEALITETLRQEESRFQQMLARGLRLLDDAVAELGAGQDLPGDVAFRLYDTYGFPLDLTEDALRAQGRGVDRKGFNAAMAAQRAEARAAWAGSGETATEALWFDLKERHGACEFLGYDAEVGRGTILALVKDGALVDQAQAGDKVAVVADQTPFYGESGGQMGDTGVIVGPESRLSVDDTAKPLGLTVHHAKVEHGILRVGDVASFEVDAVRRSALRANHSATHLLHEALRRVLGLHVAQKGSLVAPDRLRFDFSHMKPMTADELASVEAEVNAMIRANEPVETRVMSPDAAIEAGALALFGEKYGDEVRVLFMGRDQAAAARGGRYSIEFCGGTHVRRLGDIGLFKIISESAVSAGVRRIEALTGEAARAYFSAQEARLQEAAALLKTAPGDVPARLQALLDERRKLERELSETRKKLALGGAGQTAAGPEMIDGVAFIGRVLDGVNAKELRGLIDAEKQRHPSAVIALIAVNDGKASIATGVTDDLTARVSAVELVRAAAEAVGGKGGGGRPDMAQAGGPDGAAADQALAAVRQALRTATGA